MVGGMGDNFLLESGTKSITIDVQPEHLALGPTTIQLVDFIHACAAAEITVTLNIPTQMAGTTTYDFVDTGDKYYEFSIDNVPIVTIPDSTFTVTPVAPPALIVNYV